MRWLEWLACAAFWWNPVAWWARRRLRASEEVCCDAMAVATINAEPRTYAGALLRVIDFMSTARTPGPLTFASTIDRCGRASRLERRFRVIMTNREPTHTPRWLRAALRCGAVCLLAGGLIYCTDQSDLTSVDPARAPAASESTLLNDDSPSVDGEWPLSFEGDAGADRWLQVMRTMLVMRTMIDAVATEHALSADLTEALRDAGEAALSDRAPADLFLAVTPDGGAGDFKTVVFDLARLRSALSEGPLSPEALHAELARHLRVGQNSNMSSLEGGQFECTGVTGKVLDSSYESQIASMTMTCETANASTGEFGMRGVIERN